MTKETSMMIAFSVTFAVALLPFVKVYVFQVARAIWWSVDEPSDRGSDDETGDGDHASVSSGEEQDAPCGEERLGAVELRQRYVNEEWEFSGLQQGLEQSIRHRLAGSFSSACDQLLGERLDTGEQSFFEPWLDPRLQLSCAQWSSSEAEDLAAAQVQKMESIARQLKLKPGMRVLDIECGWGGLACYLAKYHDVHVTGISCRATNVEGARSWADREGLADRTCFMQGDSSVVHESFDRVVCVSLQEINRAPSEVEFQRLLRVNGMALVHHMRFDSAAPPTQDQDDDLSCIVARQVVDITDDLLATVNGWLHRLAQAWSRGSLHGFGPQKRAWEFTVCCLAGACSDDSRVLQEVVYYKTQTPSQLTLTPPS